MKVTYSFLDLENKPNVTPLTQLKLIKDITDKKIEVSEELLNRCDEVKSNLIKFPEVVSNIDSLNEIRFEPWWYEQPLKGANYKGLASVRLSEGKDSIEGDRLIFKEYPKFYSYEFAIIENLFHYLDDIDKDELKGTDLELYNKYQIALNAPNAGKVADKLADLSLKKNEFKL